MSYNAENGYIETNSMPLPIDAYFQLTSDLRICRLLNGLWQLSGGHGFLPDPNRAIPNMLEYHDMGLTTWDLADHYGPSEEYIGRFRQELARRRGEAAPDTMQAFTKWVPRPGRMTRQVVETAIDVSRTRMGVAALDMIQFHWWEYSDNAYLDALGHMADLQREGKIRHLSLTNFNTEYARRILDKGIRIVSNQVQYSIIDRRPEVALTPFCEQNDMYLLTYGTLCGGLLSDRYLRKPEPNNGALGTASLRKYKQMIDAWGGWTLFQELLAALRQIADRYQVSIANVAARYILEKPRVAGVIAGVRLGVSDNRVENARVFDFKLDQADLDKIQAVTSRSRDLYKLIGDTGDEYRR